MSVLCKYVKGKRGHWVPLSITLHFITTRSLTLSCPDTSASPYHIIGIIIDKQWPTYYLGAGIQTNFSSVCMHNKSYSTLSNLYKPHKVVLYTLTFLLSLTMYFFFQMLSRIYHLFLMIAILSGVRAAGKAVLICISTITKMLDLL